MSTSEHAAREGLPPRWLLPVGVIGIATIFTIYRSDTGFGSHTVIALALAGIIIIAAAIHQRYHRYRPAQPEPRMSTLIILMAILGSTGFVSVIASDIIRRTVGVGTPAAHLGQFVSAAAIYGIGIAWYLRVAATRRAN